MGKLTANIPEELHQKVRDEVAADESLTTSMVVQRAMEAYYSKGGNKMNESTRTLAFQIPEGLFHRIQSYLAAQRQQAGKIAILEHVCPLAAVDRVAVTACQGICDILLIPDAVPAVLRLAADGVPGNTVDGFLLHQRQVVSPGFSYLFC